MGKTVVPASITSLRDLLLAEEGVIEADKVRTVAVPDALVDTGATMLSIPRSLVARLGLRKQRSRMARTSGGVVEFAIPDAVRLTVLGRECIVDVAEVPDDCPVLIGQVPLELLDFIVDPVARRLIGNPEHGGEQMIDMF
jgi:predicted aspartyl protease